MRVEAVVAMPESDDGDPRWSFELGWRADGPRLLWAAHTHCALGRWAAGEPMLQGAVPRSGPERRASTSRWRPTCCSRPGPPDRCAAAWPTPGRDDAAR